MDNVDKLIASLNNSRIENKHIKTADGEEVVAFIKRQLFEDEKHLIGCVKCIFKNDRFLIIKKIIEGKEVAYTEKGKQKHYLSVERHRIFGSYAGVKGIYKDNSIYAILIIPYPPDKIEYSIIFGSFGMFLETITYIHIKEIEKESTGGWYCENE